MKKIMAVLLMLVLSVAMLAGCTNAKPADKDGAAKDREIKFAEKDGLLTYTDLKNSPFAESGLQITIKKGENGYAKFVKTDLQGKATKEYYLFNYANNTAEKYYYVSAMGTAFYYYYDLAKKELIKVEDGEHNDTTQKTKDSNRWDKAAQTMDEEVKALEKYYSEQYKMTIEQAVKK